MHYEPFSILTVMLFSFNVNHKFTLYFFMFKPIIFQFNFTFIFSFSLFKPILIFTITYQLKASLNEKLLHDLDFKIKLY